MGPCHDLHRPIDPVSGRAHAAADAPGVACRNVQVCVLSIDFAHAGSKFCPVTGQLIHGWVVMQTNYELRILIEQWAAKQGVDLEALDRLAKLMTSRSMPL